MATVQKNNTPQSAQDFISLQDLFSMCLAKWQWFVLSLLVCLGVAVCYLLRTEPSYTRAASILIKDDGKGRTVSSEVSGGFADLGLFSTRTNVYNEVGTLQSPDVIRKVVQRLHLEMTYQVPGRFHRKTVYGKTLPASVEFLDLDDKDFARCELELRKDGTVSLSRFEMNGESLDGKVEGRPGATLQSPAGKIVVNLKPKRAKASKRAGKDEGDEEESKVVYVSRSSISSAIAAYSSRLTVAQADENSNIIALSYVDVSTQRAEDILSTHIAVYNEDWVKDKNQIAVSTSMFINERLGVIEGELGHVDENISSFKSANLLTDVQASANMYISQASEAESVVRDLNNEVYMARYIRDHLRSDKSKNQMIPANSGLKNQGIASQINEYNKQLLERNSLVANSSESNPLVMQMDASLEAMRQALLTSIDNELVSLNTQIKSQQSYGGQATSKIASNPKQAKYLLSVERQQKVKESLYLYLLQKREENELSQAFTAYNTRIITMPTGSNRPTAPVSRNILLVAVAMGLLIPVVVIFTRESMNTVVRGRKDLEKLSLPVIGEVPQCAAKKKKLQLRLRRKPGEEEEMAVVVKPGSRNIINEAFRVLRTNLEFMSDDSHSQNVFVVTSFNAGSGKSFLSLNIAVSLAIKDKKVLLIDGDMRHATASTYLGSPKPGLSDYLGGKVNDIANIIVRSEESENLSVVPVGTIPPNPTELLFSERLKELIDSAREQYDYVFIDCPPVEMVADTQIIEKLADRTIFVIRAGLFERSMLPELENLYTEKKYKNMSVILNGTESASGRYGYKYGYRYGYHYGYGTNYHYASDDEK